MSSVVLLHIYGTMLRILYVAQSIGISSHAASDDERHVGDVDVSHTATHVVDGTETLGNPSFRAIARGLNQF